MSIGVVLSCFHYCIMKVSHSDNIGIEDLKATVTN